MWARPAGANENGSGGQGQSDADAGVIVVGHAPTGAIDAIAARHAGRSIVDLAGVARLEELAEAAYEGICW